VLTNAFGVERFFHYSATPPLLHHSSPAPGAALLVFSLRTDNCLPPTAFAKARE